MRNVSEPTYFGSGHVLNSKLVSEPCKQSVHDRNFTEHNFRHYFKTLHQGSYTRIAHTCTRESAVHMQFAHNISDQERQKSTHKSHTFCA